MITPIFLFAFLQNSAKASVSRLVAFEHKQTKPLENMYISCFTAIRFRLNVFFVFILFSLSLPVVAHNNIVIAFYWTFNKDFYGYLSVRLSEQ